MWPKVVEAYAKKALSEDVALQMARIARICQRDDYDYKRKEVILWTPPSSGNP
jgi:DNA polymerase-1